MGSLSVGHHGERADPDGYRDPRDDRSSKANPGRNPPAASGRLALAQDFSRGLRLGLPTRTLFAGLPLRVIAQPGLLLSQHFSPVHTTASLATAEQTVSL